MPKPKYPIPNNNFPRFINEYLRGHSESQNDMAHKINKMLPDEFEIPMDNSEMKSGNSNIFSWKKGIRPKEPVIREALCKFLHITYIESLFLIPCSATDYTLSVFNYLATFIKNMPSKKRNTEYELSLNMYNIGPFVNQSSNSSKNYLNLSYLISKLIKTEQDKVELIHRKKYHTYFGSVHERPWSFWQYSQTNIYCSNEKNNQYYWSPSFMLDQLGKSFDYLKGDMIGLIKTDLDFNDDANYAYYRLALFNDSNDENLMCFCAAINLLIKMLDRIDDNYLDRLNKYGISEKNTVYNSLPNILLENNDLFLYRK